MKARAAGHCSGLALLAVLVWSAAVWAAGDGVGTAYQPVTLDLNDGVQSQAVFFKGEGPQAVVFLRTGRSTKESWYALAQRLQQDGIASLPVDGGTVQDVVSAVDLLKCKGFARIALVGGSAAGRAVLNAVVQHPDACINKVIVLAPMGGAVLERATIEKLIVVGKQDPMGLYAYMLHEQSAEPKVLEEYPTASHALELLNSQYKENLARLIIAFVKR